MKKRILRILSVCLSICFLLISTFTLITYAYADQSVNFTFNSFASGRGYVDGSSNGTYYSLLPGNVSLTISTYSVLDTQSNQYVSGYSCLVDLMNGTKSYGTRVISNTSSIGRWVADANSTGYYLYACGQQPCTYKIFHIEGTLHDHY
ncbi:hypothetical protein [Pseudobacteroides cellulosolvens]|uniref:Uncharacterized protein n=1 Tax=Pseudobacteroides cellulosolvens ATCC 35603 = DSM 2933 TaxID=398512 RepID=A0A0L6JYH8_9FIRM|nr:hypothetical protein [Pseudobacteroides cellulosolvens]KNY30517.1 hypothetical protein Bccel_5797 [Pseudobacteroides cellulosolvens ATCC 35603 = DSM 2933]